MKQWKLNLSLQFPLNQSYLPPVFADTTDTIANENIDALLVETAVAPPSATSAFESIPTIQVTNTEFLEAMNLVLGAVIRSSSTGDRSSGSTSGSAGDFEFVDIPLEDENEKDSEFKMALSNLRAHVDNIFKMNLFGFDRKTRKLNPVNKETRTFLKAHSGYYYALLDERPYSTAYKIKDFVALDLQSGTYLCT